QGNRNPFSGNRAGNNNIGNRANINNVNVHNNNFNNFHNNALNNNWHHNYNNYWHHGYWPGYGHGWGWGGGWGWGWGYPWGAAALGGMIGWGLGSMYYSSGYGSYSNPYYVATPAYAGTYLDYSQPIPVSADTQSYAQTDGSTDPNAPVITPADTPPSPEVQAALKPFDDARTAFKAGDYNQALTKVDEALKSLPNDAALHEFRALVLFAQAKYQEAAAVIYSVLSVGPGWDWTTLSSMYADVDVYTKQLRTLEDYSKAHPDSADAAFVLGYQYLSCGHNEAAAKQFQTVARLLPNDQLAPQLVKMIGAKSGDQEPPQPPPSADPNAKPALPPEDDGPPIDKSKIVGTWKSARGKAVAIDLALKGDGSFTWKVNQGGRTNVIEGQYEVEGNLLMLKQTSDGNTMVGRVLMADKPGFNFKLVGSGPNDPGLDFAK
ncbi:MAG TPA: tetratricopeptide repeat protein, partial [Planctomycetaceae bacterium]|nr:tetratricopeptide repeat protein [Planctomycetaceae bacterium]